MKLMKVLCSILMVIAIFGCQGKPPCETTGYEQMQSVLKEGIKADRKVALREKVPHDVTEELLPTVNPPPVADRVSTRRFNISANNMEARAFFMSLVEGTPYNVVVDPKVNGTISMNLKHVTIEQAIEAVHDVYGYEFRGTSYGFEVLPPDIQTRIFNVNYLDVKRKGKSITQFNSGQLSDLVSSYNNTSTSGSSGSPGIPTPQSPSTPSNSTGESISNSSVDTRSEINFWRDLEKTLKQMVGTQAGHSVIVNAQAGVVVVHAYPNELIQIARYLDQLQNNLSRQVVLEAKILEIDLSSQFQSGINWNLLGQIYGFDMNGNPLINNPHGVEAITSTTGWSQSSLWTFDNTDLTDFSGFLALSKKGNFGFLIKLLETQGNVQVLSSPRISTVNNQKAVIKVGQDEFFVTGVSTTYITNGSSTTPTQSVSLMPFFSGVTLDVTPQISNNGTVVLHIHPSISTVKNQQKNILLSTPISLPMALSTIRESDNIVRAKSGQIVVIGGLMSTTMSEEIAGAPGISKIPYLGTLFRRTGQLAQKSELVILLKPVVIQKQTWENELEHESQTFSQYKRGFHFSSLPDVFGTEGETEKCHRHCKHPQKVVENELLVNDSRVYKGST